MPEVKRAGLQRVRVGLTGLGAVLLIVAISTAIFETASSRDDASAGASANRTEQAVANMVANEVEPPGEPLAEMGVTPTAPATPAVDNNVAPAK